jgi:sensor c-di-GMP phosphodiesterase-like protein
VSITVSALKLNPVLVVAYLVGVAAIATPITLALNYTDRQSLRELESQAAILASQALRRNEQITAQVYQAVQEMEAANLKDPCSPQAMERMVRASMRASRLQAVGYVENNRLLCSSLGFHGAGLDVGVAEYVSPGGLTVRSDRRLPYDDKSVFRISTSVKSGYTAIVHTDNAFDILDNDAEIGVGLIGLGNMRPISQVGVWKPEWTLRLGSHSKIGFYDGEYIVAFERSSKYAYFTYAAIPGTRLAQACQSQALVLVPLGVAAGLLLGFSVYLVARQQLGLPAQLRSALRRGELYLLYQPIIHLASGQWVGAEALLRWRRPDGEHISPAVFIPMAERTQLIGRITAHVLDRVAHEAGALLRERPDFFISVNFASTDLHDPTLLEQLEDVVRRHGIRPACVHIEATERTFIDATGTREPIQRIRGLGHQVVIDDFGTGYSSLSYLTQLEVDGLKIDKSFVDTIGTDAVTSHVVSHIIAMAQSLKLLMVAEGVETEAQAAYLRERGVQLAQGWHFARPMRIDALQAQLAAAPRA